MTTRQEWADEWFIETLTALQQQIAEAEQQATPPIRYRPCTNHEASIEVEGYCPCWDGLEIDWEAMGEGKKAAELGWI